MLSSILLNLKVLLSHSSLKISSDCFKFIFVTIVANMLFLNDSSVAENLAVRSVVISRNTMFSDRSEVSVGFGAIRSHLSSSFLATAIRILRCSFDRLIPRLTHLCLYNLVVIRSIWRCHLSDHRFSLEAEIEDCQDYGYQDESDDKIAHYSRSNVWGAVFFW